MDKADREFAFLPAKLVFVGIKPSQVLSTAVNFAPSTLVTFSQTVRRYSIIPLGSERHFESNCLANKHVTMTRDGTRINTNWSAIGSLLAHFWARLRPPISNIHPDKEITHSTYQRLPCCLEILLTDFKLCIQQPDFTESELEMKKQKTNIRCLISLKRNRNVSKTLLILLRTN